MCQYVVGGDQVCSIMVFVQLLVKCYVEKFFDDCNVFGMCGVSCVGGGFYVQVGDVFLLYVLQEIFIIGGQFDYQGLCVQVQVCCNYVYIVCGMCQLGV